MRRLTLHIGAHKTGTTTLQATLRHNEALLRTRGMAIAYVPPLPHVHRHLGFHSPDQFFPHGFSLHDPMAFVDFLANQPADHVFASSENFSFVFQQNVLDDLAAALRAKFDHIEILIYLRRQDRQAVSHHQEGGRPNRRAEAALWGHGLNALPDAAQTQRLYLDYDARLMLWENAFGRDALRVRVYDRALLVQGDIVVDALKVMAIDHQGLARLPDQNVTLSYMQAIVGHLANDSLGDDVVTARLLAALPKSGAKMLPSAQAAREFLAPYIASNRRLNARLQISATLDLFCDDFSDYPQSSPQTPSQEDWANALRAVITTLGHAAAPHTDLTADDLRKAAVALEKNDAPTALRLISAAHTLRPHGPYINQLKAALEARLRKPNGI